VKNLIDTKNVKLEIFFRFEKKKKKKLDLVLFMIVQLAMLSFRVFLKRFFVTLTMRFFSISQQLLLYIGVYIYIFFFFFFLYHSMYFFSMSFMYF